MNDIPRDQFLELHDQLAEQHPKSINEARRLAEMTVDPASACERKMWRILWDKPLFANARVKTAERWVDRIKAEMDGSWQTWGKPEEFNIHHSGSGIHRDCFEFEGKAARDFGRRHTIPRHRLYAIQGAAKALRSRSGQGRPPFADLPGKPLSKVVDELCADFGRGWGKITVLHALADMGLAVKPDLNLTNTMRHPGLDSRDPLEINEHVRKLLSALGTNGRTDIPNEIRYLDKVLMEISRQGIIETSSDRMAEDILKMKRRLDSHREEPRIVWQARLNSLPRRPCACLDDPWPSLAVRHGEARDID